MDMNESARRYRARKRGERVPLLKRGPKRGYKQSREHIEKRKRFGAEHWRKKKVRGKKGRVVGSVVKVGSKGQVGKGVSESAREWMKTVLGEG